MWRIVPLATGVAAILTSGALHGWLTGRWGNNSALATAVASKMAKMPLQVGNWRGEVLPTQDAGLLGNVYGYFSGRYTNNRDGNSVTVFLLGGPPGPVAIHTPDACYPANGYEMVGQAPLSVPVPGADSAEFWSADFLRTRAAEQSRLHILWSWNAGGRWLVPDSPRLTFAQYPVLYKLYVIREVPHYQEKGGTDPAQDFLQVLLPTLEQSLFTHT
jgi:hypothetical protein